mmetsp:Transcript_39763/g.64258  ORF Transcript_39763/g.64258 Transcript_39763/m.64258 type:complete len:201 (-) Transcript_39763:908-1510(-)
MSTSIRLRSRPCKSLGKIMGSLLPVAVKTTSLRFITSHISSRPATLALLPPRAFTRSSSSTACAFSTDLFTSVTSMPGSLLKSASSKSLDIFPAPMIQIWTLLECLRRSSIVFDIISSTAALDTETEPLPILVLVRTILPILMPALSIFAMILPPEPDTISSCSGSALSMQCSWHALTWDRICASPKTRESKPELTSKRC